MPAPNEGTWMIPVSRDEGGRSTGAAPALAASTPDLVLR